MASVQTGAIRRQIQKLFGVGPVAGLGDGELLERYAIDRDESAFEAIVALHGPMVLAVCRRMLDDAADAEDAFQATFLVLIRRASSLGPGIALGPWLYGVACRVCLRSRSVAARRRTRERPVAGSIDVATVEVRPMPEESELREAIDEELLRLPSAYRSIVVLCDLEGRTHVEAARQLGWPLGTVKGRLARARARLRSRLVRLGLAPSAAGLSSLLVAEAGAAVPSGWLAITIEAARRAAAGEAVAGVVPAATVALAEGVVQAMKLQTIAGDRRGRGHDRRVGRRCGGPRAGRRRSQGRRHEGRSAGRETGRRRGEAPARPPGRLHRRSVEWPVDRRREASSRHPRPARRTSDDVLSPGPFRSRTS